MNLPRWLSRLLPFGGGDDDEEGDDELQRMTAALDESESRMTEAERRIVAALGVHADVWRSR